MIKSVFKLLPSLIFQRQPSSLASMISNASPSLQNLIKYNCSKDKQNYTKQHHSDKKNHEHPGEQHKKPHSHHEKGTKEEEHVHGPNCKHHHHQPQNQNASLAHLSFEELLNLNTAESIKYAEKKISELEGIQKQKNEEIEQYKKNIDFFDKLEAEIQEKEQKLEENIIITEEEIKLSKKRAEKQVQESKSYAVTKIAKELLEVADCISHCKKLAESLIGASPNDPYIQQLINSKERMIAFLKKYQIEEFDPIGTEYDPNTQESLLQIPTPPNFKANNVAMTMRTGYMIKGRLLRSARVGIFN